MAVIQNNARSNTKQTRFLLGSHFMPIGTTNKKKGAYLMDKAHIKTGSKELMHTDLDPTLQRYLPNSLTRSYNLKFTMDATYLQPITWDRIFKKYNK